MSLEVGLLGGLLEGLGFIASVVYRGSIVYPLRVCLKVSIEGREGGGWGKGCLLRGPLGLI